MAKARPQVAIVFFRVLLKRETTKQRNNETTKQRNNETTKLI
jgi:hypothetical protein